MVVGWALCRLITGKLENGPAYGAPKTTMQDPLYQWKSLPGLDVLIDWADADPQVVTANPPGQRRGNQPGQTGRPGLSAFSHCHLSPGPLRPDLGQGLFQGQGR